MEKLREIFSNNYGAIVGSLITDEKKAYWLSDDKGVLKRNIIGKITVKLLKSKFYPSHWKFFA